VCIAEDFTAEAVDQGIHSQETLPPPGDTPTFADTFGSPIDFKLHGEFRNETAYRIAEPNDFTKIRNFAYLDAYSAFSPSLSFELAGWFFYDAVFDLTNNFNQHVEDDLESEAQLRKAFVDIGAGNWEFRLGKQQIVWGQAVNLFFADVVNPKDLREFILWNLDEIRIPVWAADVEYFVGDTHVELVWIPVPEFNKLAVTGSDFAFRAPELPSGVGLRTDDVKEPEDSPENSVYGGRLSHIVQGWALSAFYLYGYDYFPVYYREIRLDPITSDAVVSLTPEYERMNIVGATFSKEIKDVIFKGELVFNKDRFFSVTDPLDADGVIESDYFEYLLGIDYTFFNRIDFNVQFFQQFILDHAPSLFDDEVMSFFSIWLQTGFLDNRLEPELFAVSSIRQEDYMLRPRLNYKFRQNWRMALGLDIFGGVSDGDFGQFDNADRSYVEVGYFF
jgi:hypothetical protein